MVRQIPWILGWFMKTCFRSLETLVSVSAVCYNFICLAANKIIQVWMWILFCARMEKTGGPGNWISVETSWCPLHFESSLGQSRGPRSSPGQARWLSAVWVLCSKALSPHRRSGYSCCSSPPRTSCSLTVAPCWATPGEEEVEVPTLDVVAPDWGITVNTMSGRRWRHPATAYTRREHRPPSPTIII